MGIEYDGSTEVFAFYTGAPVTTPELVRRLRDELPAGVAPRWFQHLDELPLNANRKIDRLRLGVLAQEISAAPRFRGA